MKNKYINTFTGHFFRWSGNIGICDQSEFESKGGGSQIYDDACDYGFEVIGNHSNILFTYVSTEQGDVSIDVYISDCDGFAIHIYNT